jgi:hypothetical protein
VLAFETHDYTLDYVADVADLAHSAGISPATEPILSTPA